MDGPRIHTLTDRVARAKAFVQDYLDELNRDDDERNPIAPDGSDFNDLADGVLAILQGGATPVISLTEDGR